MHSRHREDLSALRERIFLIKRIPVRDAREYRPNKLFMKLFCSHGMRSFLRWTIQVCGCRETALFSLGREYRRRIQSEKWISNLVRAWSICCTAKFRSRFTFWHVQTHCVCDLDYYIYFTFLRDWMKFFQRGILCISILKF